MPFTVIVGCQWGDEGKGRVVDLLSAEFDWVARFQGGANAGHTVIADGRRFILHLVPTGIVRSDVRCAIGNGVVLDPQALMDEVAELEAASIRCRDRLRISALAHVVTPLHKLREALTSQDTRIGTTGRGIGPAYEDRAARHGLRVEDLLDRAVLKDRLDAQWERLEVLARAAGVSVAEKIGSTREDLVARLYDAGGYLAPMTCDVSDLLLNADDRGERILCEGAQGAWLDVDHGTYPYVTSSNTTSGGACIGLGVPPTRIGHVLGVVKAYATRVGRGPFPTEFEPDMNARFREKAGEYGATTRRPRRCGWYDAVLARKSCRLNGVDRLIVTKLDVLSGVGDLSIATRYGWLSESRGPGDRADGEPWLSTNTISSAIPKYETLNGWTEDVSQAESLHDLPRSAVRYLERVQALTGVGIARVSVGPRREQSLVWSSAAAR
jgi:adenylosuccinate synthase